PARSVRVIRTRTIDPIVQHRITRRGKRNVLQLNVPMRRDGLLYALTISCSAALLFLVQPMIAKAILPRFGVTAGVWVTCMLFVQVALLAGYLYSYWLTRLSRRLQTSIHLVLL